MVATGEVILVLGGTRSGKSAVAEGLVAAGLPPVTYVATGADPDGSESTDPEWRARVAAHRRRRPATWGTVEVSAGGDLGPAVGGLDGAVLVDSLGTWLAGFVANGTIPGAGTGADPGTDPGTGPGTDPGAGPATDVVTQFDELCAALDARRRRGLRTVVVSEEVGLGVHSATELGRRFADVLGELNQAVASTADRVVLVVAGRTLELGPVQPEAERAVRP